MPDSVQSARIAASLLWAAYRLVLEMAGNDRSYSRELTEHMIKLQEDREDGFRKCTDFTEVSSLLHDCLWRIDKVFGVNRSDEWPAAPITASDVMQARMSLILILDLGYRLRETGYVRRLMPFLDRAIPDNATVDLMLAALGSMVTERG